VGVSSPTGPTGEIFALGETGTDCSDLITGNSDSSAGGNDSGCDATCSSLSEGERATFLLDSVTSAICEDDVGISGRSDAKVGFSLACTNSVKVRSTSVVCGTVCAVGSSIVCIEVAVSTGE